MDDPRISAQVPIRAPGAERMSTQERLNVRAQAKTAPVGLLQDIMTGFEQLHKSTGLPSKKVKPKSTKIQGIVPLQDPLPQTPMSPKKPKGSRNIPKPIQKVMATNDPNSKRPTAPRIKMKRSGPSRPLVRRVKSTKYLSSTSEDSEDEASRGKDLLIAKQLEKFKPKKRVKRLRKRHLEADKQQTTTDTRKLRAIGADVTQTAKDTVDLDMRALFGDDGNDLDDPKDTNNNISCEPGLAKQKANGSFSTETAPSEEDKGIWYLRYLFFVIIFASQLEHDPVALALASADISLTEFAPKDVNTITTYKGNVFL